MKPSSWQDVSGLAGMVLFCAFLLSLIPWPDYRDEQDFATPADRRDAERQMIEHQQALKV